MFFGAYEWGDGVAGEDVSKEREGLVPNTISDGRSFTIAFVFPVVDLLS